MNRYRITDLETKQTVSVFASNRYDAVALCVLRYVPCKVERWEPTNRKGGWELVGYHNIERRIDERQE